MKLMFVKSKILIHVNISKGKSNIKYDKSSVYNLTVKNVPSLENNPDNRIPCIV